MGLFLYIYSAVNTQKIYQNIPLDYYAFGAPQPSRNYNQYTGATGYRYNFNGKEQDVEIVGTAGGTQDYGMRIYNPSLGRPFSIDPLAKNFPELSPYQFFSNSPIANIDFDGLEKIFYMGAFSNSGYSTLVHLVNKTEIYKNGVQDFQNISKNKGYDLLVIEGNVGGSGGETFTKSQLELQSIFESDDIVGTLYDGFSGRIAKDKITDDFIANMKETYESGNDLIISVINEGNVKKSEGTPLDRVLNRKQTAFSVIHEVIAHALATSQETKGATQEPESQHKNFFGKRDKSGTLINGGEDCKCGAGRSPNYGEEHPSSTAGKARKQLEKVVSSE